MCFIFIFKVTKKTAHTNYDLPRRIEDDVAVLIEHKTRRVQTKTPIFQLVLVRKSNHNKATMNK